MPLNNFIDQYKQMQDISKSGMSYNADQNQIVDGQGNFLGSPQDMGLTPQQQVSQINPATGARVDVTGYQGSNPGQDVTPSVSAMYQSMLGRTASPDEIAGWQSVANQGQSLSQINQGIASSDEYRQKVMPFSHEGDQGAVFTNGSSYFQQNGFKAGDQHYEGVPTAYYDPKSGQLAAWYGTTGGNATSDYGWHTPAEIQQIQATDGNGNPVTMASGQVSQAKESTYDAGAMNRDALKGVAMVLGSMAGAAYLAPMAGAVTTGAEGSAIAGTEAGVTGMAPGSSVLTGAEGSAVAGTEAGSAPWYQGIKDAYNTVKPLKQAYDVIKTGSGLISNAQTPTSTSSLASNVATSYPVAAPATIPMSTDSGMTVAQLQSLQGLKTPAEIMRQAASQQSLAMSSPSGLISGARA